MEFIIYKCWRGWAIWESTPDWRNHNPVSPYFIKREQAEEYEQKLLKKKGSKL